MSAVLIISIFLVGLVTYALHRSKRSTTTEDSSGHLSPPPPQRALFDAAQGETKSIAETVADSRRELYARASRGDLDALREAADG